MSDSESPFVTIHAGDRFDERAPDDSVAPETAWAHGQRITTKNPFRCDEVRYHQQSGTLLLRRVNHIETVYDVDALKPDYYNAVKHAIPEREMV